MESVRAKEKARHQIQCFLTLASRMPTRSHHSIYQRHQPFRTSNHHQQRREKFTITAPPPIKSQNLLTRKTTNSGTPFKSNSQIETHAPQLKLVPLD